MEPDRRLTAQGMERKEIAEQMTKKSKRVDVGRVGTVVARGEAELGFQQISELLEVPGVDLVGPLPPEVQRVTVFSAGVAAGSKHPEAARALIEYVRSPAGLDVIAKSGLEPISGR